MTTPVKWALAAGVLVLAVIVALLPREDSSPSPPAAQSGDNALGDARARAGLAACPADQTPAAAGPLAGVRAECLGTGGSVDLGAATRGKRVLLNVWATWCQPCTTELPVLRNYAAQPDAIPVLGVQVASDAVDGLALLTRIGVRLPSVYDGAGASGPIRTALRVPPNLPASYLVTPDGSVRFIESPRTFTDVGQVHAAVTKYGEPS